jgi:hypothetical protein
MIELDKVKDMLNDYRNSVKHDFTKEELDEIDNYTLKVLSEIEPVIALIDTLKSNDAALDDMKKYLDNVMKEEQWLEKLLKTS